MEKEKRNKILKGIYILVVLVILLGLLVLLIMLMSGRDVSEMKKFNDCLAENGMVIYGNNVCPACGQLVKDLGGYEAVISIYVDCMEEQQKCNEEKKTGYVPEIQIDGEVYEGSRTIEAFAEETGCEIPN